MRPLLIAVTAAFSAFTLWVLAQTGLIGFYEQLLGTFYASGERFGARELAEFIAPYQAPAEDAELDGGAIFRDEQSGEGDTTPIEVPQSAVGDAERDLQELLDRSEGERPWQIRDELGASMLENFGVFREEQKMLRQLEIVDDLRERYANVYVEDKGEIFNSDLTQAIELGYMLELAACMLQAGVALASDGESAP